MTFRLRLSVLILFVVVAGATVLYTEESTSVNILVGRSTIVDVGTPIARVSLTSPEVADALVTSSAQLLLHGKAPGTISMFIWDKAGAIRRYDVVVQRDLSRLSSQVLELFPGEHISVQGNGRSVVVAGTASSKYVADKAVEVAAGYVEKKEDVVNLLQVQANPPSQVLLHVRFAEVSRSALTELGASLFTSALGIKNTLARTTTQQFPAPRYDELNYTKASSDFGSDVTSASGKITFSDFLNVFLFSEKYDLGAVLRLLSVKGMFQSLAEPNLVTESGKEASFLAGGEIPVPIAQGTGGNVAISVQWKEFGIRLNFTPTVNGERVNLKVRPEVSTLDFNNAVVLQGFRIPALTTRRADTEIELRNNQTFAIAGLLNNSVTQSLQKVAGIGDIPVLGLLFKSKAAQKDQTELVVMITPEILPAGSPGVTRDLPRMIEPNLPPVSGKKTFPAPAPAFSPGSGTMNAVPSTTPTVNASAGSQASQVPATTAAPTSPAAHEPTKAERKAMAEREQADLAAKAELDKSNAKLAVEQARRDKQLAAEQARKNQQAAVEQAQKDRQAAVEQARKDRAAKEQAEKAAHEQARRDAEQAKRDAETAKRQAEVDRQHQKQIDEAAAKLKAAEQAYQAEVAKGQSNGQSSAESK